MNFELEGYELMHIDQNNKGRGGVAFYVDKNLDFRVLKNISVTVNNVLDCMTIEIYKDKNKSALISCIYRTPGSSIELFRDLMKEMFIKKCHKKIFICGDFNIDLLNSNNHKMTNDFINTIYSMNLYPTITRPTRITSHCATLIDNIFTNDISNKTLSVLLISDISDHLISQHLSNIVVTHELVLM